MSLGPRLPLIAAVVGLVGLIGLFIARADRLLEEFGRNLPEPVGEPLERRADARAGHAANFAKTRVDGQSSQALQRA